ncbi:Uncharacterised protein [Segatella copri]|nr:Uncharacterised protein [Segatella copri]
MMQVPAGDWGWAIILPEASKQNTPLFCTVHHVSPFSPCAIDETLLPMM